MAFITPSSISKKSDIPQWINDALQIWGYSNLNPMQLKLIKEGLIDSKHSVVCAPTGSGKTLLAILKIYQNLQSKSGKCVYVVPLRALAREKAIEFKRMFEPFSAVISLASGDLDSSDDDLHLADIIVTTSEKMDSLQRHKPTWLKEISLTIIDETHLLADGTRGATLEVVICKLKENNSDMLCMSATVPNANELAKWLGARLFVSTWRSTPLIVGIYSTGRLYIDEQVSSVGEKDFLFKLADLALLENQNNGQLIVFTATRKSAESTALELSKHIGTKLDLTSKEECLKISSKILKALPNPTDQCQKESDCTLNGVSFHHAGLADKQREAIEEGFKVKRCVKCLVATTTLAMGVDFPASWVIVKDVKRFSNGYSSFMPNLEIQQMLGRAGRPRYDKRGVGVICCSQKDILEVRGKYVDGPLEKIYSQLSSQPSLRAHTLALIATGHCTSIEQIKEFFSKTFFAHQYGDFEKLMDSTISILNDLSLWNFIREKDGYIAATPIGKRVSELYLDPLSASMMTEFIKTNSQNNSLSDFSILVELSSLIESKPLPAVNVKEEQALWEEVFATLDGDNLRRLELDEEGLNKYKQAKVTNAWINEADEQWMLENFSLPPGFLHSKMKIQEWLAYSFSELAYVSNSILLRNQARKIQKRIRYGIKAELLDLVRLRGIGRVRARKLFNSGLVDRQSIAKADKSKVIGVLGPKNFQKTIDQLIGFQ